MDTKTATTSESNRDVAKVDDEELKNVLEGFRLVEELELGKKESNLEKRVRIFRCVDTKNDQEYFISEFILFKSFIDPINLNYLNY